MKQILIDLKNEIDVNTIILGNFNTPFTSMDKSLGQKIKKNILALKNMLKQKDLTDEIHSLLKYT